VSYHANVSEGIQLIAGLRILARFLETNADVPAPRWVDVMVFPTGSTEHEMRREVDRIAILIGAQVDDQTAVHGHYTTARNFGPVDYRAVFIPADSRKHREEKASYADNIITSTHEEK
jgi:hypothetical protein